MDEGTLIYISLGSNIQPQSNLLQAIKTLRAALGDFRVSTIYQSPAVGMQGDDFLNAVVAGRTEKSIEEVVRWLRDIEQQHGRVRTDNKFDDRPLDLDLLLYGKVVTASLPHREIEQQAYVLQPLADIAATMIHPVSNQSIATLNTGLRNRCPEKYQVLTPVVLPEGW